MQRCAARRPAEHPRHQCKTRRRIVAHGRDLRLGRGERVCGARLTRADPGEDALVHSAGLFDVEKVARAFDDVHSRAGGEVTLRADNERGVNTTVAIPVEIERRLWGYPQQRRVLGGVRVRRAAVEPGLLCSVVADRGREVFRLAQAPLHAEQLLRGVVAR